MVDRSRSEISRNEPNDPNASFPQSGDLACCGAVSDQVYEVIHVCRELQKAWVIPVLCAHPATDGIVPLYRLRPYTPKDSE